MIGLLNDIISSIASVFSTVLSFLPQTPFTWSFPSGSIMAMFDYFIPISGMASILTAYVGAVVIWYCYRWILRVVKFIG